MVGWHADTSTSANYIEAIDNCIGVIAKVSFPDSENQWGWILITIIIYRLSWLSPRIRLILDKQILDKQSRHNHDIWKNIKFKNNYQFEVGTATIVLFTILLLASISASTIYGSLTGSKLCLIPFLFLQVRFGLAVGRYGVNLINCPDAPTFNDYVSK